MSVDLSLTRLLVAILAASVGCASASNLGRRMLNMEPSTLFQARILTDCGDGQNFCQNGGTCNSDADDGSFLGCDCDPGHVGQYCQCENVGQPDLCAGIDCGSDIAGHCVWDCGPTASCSCYPGFMLIGGKCVNINECDLDQSICDEKPNSECMDTEGSYECPCRDGFTDVGEACQRLCPTGSWTPHGEACYYAPSPRLTPAEARDICHGSGSDLVCQVADDEELAFIGLLSQGTTWLGYTDNDHEGSYVCAYDADDSFSGTAGKPPLEWESYEPNGQGSENCVALVHNQWASVDCNEEHRFVCELLNPTEGLCPDGWTPHTANGAASCYWNPPGKASFYMGREFCKLAVPDSDLMIVDSRRENDVVASWYGFLQASGPTYIGYTRRTADSNDWIWVGQGSPTLHENWLPKMPSNKPGVQECAVLVPSKMMDVSCNEQQNFICKSDTEHELPFVAASLDD